MDTNDIVRRAAADLVPEFGAELVETTEQAIAGKLAPEPEPTRDWGAAEAMHAAAGVGYIVHFLMAVTPVMVGAWNASRNRGEVSLAGDKIAKRRGALHPDIERKVIDAVVRKIVGD